MSKILIRFNKSRGHPERGSMEHVWRVFDEENEYLVKHLKINVPSTDEKTPDGFGNDDWNICCFGKLSFDRETSTAIIDSK
jgi:hypothetical protein